MNVETLEFNWIFTENNAELLINLLADLENNTVLIKKSIKTFIEYMWSHYQYEITKKVFVPYVCYMIVIIYLATDATCMLDRNLREDPYNMEYHYWHSMNCSIAWCFFVFFAFSEVEQIL